MVKARRESKIMRFIGVDPGKSGGLVDVIFCNTGYQKVSLTLMPETERDLWDWFDMRTPTIPTFAYIEWIHPAIQGIGKSAQSKLYGNYLSLRMALTAAGIPFEDVKPLQWQRAFSIPPRKKSEKTTQWKHRLRGKAQQLFPTLDVWGKTKEIQLAVCDALLIAEHCRRTWRTK